jgi:hypothetical protein
MLQGRAPKRLEDVSHLFLSKNDSEKNKGTEVTVWLAIEGDRLNRAHLAAGIARGLAVQRIHVTLLELGLGLPNVGYYFALEPAEYLVQVLDGSSVISGESGPYIRYSIAREPGGFTAGERSVTPAGSPHALLAAFSCPRPGSHREFFTELGCITSRRKGDLGDACALPDGLMLITDGRRPEFDETIIRFFADANPRPVVFIARPGGRVPDDTDVDEVVALPPDISETWVKRVPPEGPFFNDFTESFLQVVSLRRRTERNAV